MSEIKVNSIKGVGASAAAITVNNTDGTCTANITNNLSNRRLTINGAMTISQRGTSSTAVGYLIDRFYNSYSGVDENPTFAQADVASGTTPYTSGFRKSIKITNGNQTSGAGAGVYIQIQHMIEAQDMASSGLNFTSASSFITLSFWVKSSVAGDYTLNFETQDGTAYRYLMEYTLSADTWTKVTKTISGNSNLTFNNDNGSGLELYIWAFIGTDYTASSVTEDAWSTYNSSARTKDDTSTWWTTNDATFELTGVQLEVGSVATDFEHRSFGQELALCQRYCYVWKSSTAYSNMGTGVQTDSSNVDITFTLPQIMRASPSFSSSGSFRTVGYDSGSQTAQALSALAVNRSHPHTPYLRGSISGGTGGAVGELGDNGSNDATGIFSAEL